MSKVSFPLSIFQDSDGTPVSFGTVLVHLSIDAKTPDPAQIAASKLAVINLDVNGNVIGSPLVWPNSELNPSDSTYIYSVYSKVGSEIVRDATIIV